jgi:hypothetical protein
MMMTMVSLASPLALALVLAAAPDQASPITDARARAAEFDLRGAIEALKTAADAGDTNAQVAMVYVRGLADAREAARQGGSPESLAPVTEAIAWLGIVSKGRPGPSEIARLALQAAAAAAQSERDEMRLYLESAVRMEMVQRAAGMPGAPLVSAAETAGDLWLQVHRYDEARRAYDDAADRFGPSLRTLAGRARAARSLNDTAAACQGFRALVDAWGTRRGEPAEIVDARAYVAGSCDGSAR